MKSEEKCAKCGTPLKTFAGYIPGTGECCLKCWTEYMANDDKTLVTRKKK